MLETINETKSNEALKLDDSVKENTKGQVILGVLEGPCADFINPTRNGRLYDESLWEKVFNSEIVNEYFEAGGIPGELDHPADRLETCSEKIAIMMPEKPKKDKDGHLVARFDILDTPNGRIAYTLAKYGYRLGISSRGGGDTYQDYDGREHVDESSYDFQAFDLVLLPAVKAARLKMVESLQGGRTFKQAINEALEKANPDEKKVMTETLDNLNIEYNHESVIDNDTKIAANDVGATVVNDLQESLLAKEKAETKVLELQEKLSVCYAKEAKYDEDVAKYKSAIRNLSESASNVKALQVKLENLTNELNKKDSIIAEKEQRYQELVEKQRRELRRQSRLTESISAKDTQLENANTKIEQLNKTINTLNEKLEGEKSALNEQLAESKKNLTIKTTEFSNKLDKANKLVEKYRTTAKLAVGKYIDLQAVRLGVRPEEIKNKLPENYSFGDIDEICESLGQYKLNISKLPFNLDTSKTTIKVKSQQDPLLKSNDDDVVDESLRKLAGLD